LSTIWWFRSIREKNSFRKHCDVRKKINVFALISKCKFSLLAQSLRQPSSVFLSTYRNTVLKQSERVFALGCFLNLESNLKIHLHLWYELRNNSGKWYLIYTLKLESISSDKTSLSRGISSNGYSSMLTNDMFRSFSKNKVVFIRHPVFSLTALIYNKASNWNPQYQNQWYMLMVTKQYWFIPLCVDVHHLSCDAQGKRRLASTQEARSVRRRAYY